MSSSSPEFTPSRSYSNFVLFMLLLVYTFNFVDRQILGILAPLIKEDLGLSDTQLGALGGIAFALLYSTLAIPLAMLADRTNRTWVVTVSLSVWSVFTALCGLSSNFWQLFLCRIGVGVGEAGGVAPSYAIISEYFPPERRARALSIYSLGIPIGLASGVMLGAAIAQAVNWRAAFIVVGLVGVVLAPIFRFFVKEPKKIPKTQAEIPAQAVFSILARKPSFWLLAFASAMSSIVGYGLAFWVPSLLMQMFEFNLTTTSYYFGSILLIGGVCGVYLGGVLGDKLGQKDRGAYAKVSAYAWMACAPFYLAAFLIGSPQLAWVLFVIPNALAILFVGPITTAIQHLVPSNMRASAAACFLFINNLIGIGGGSWLMGGLSDAMKPHYGADSLRYSAVILLSLYVVSTIFAFLAVKPLRKDWVEE